MKDIGSLPDCFWTSCIIPYTRNIDIPIKDIAIIVCILSLILPWSLKNNARLYLSHILGHCQTILTWFNAVMPHDVLLKQSAALEQN